MKNIFKKLTVFILVMSLIVTVLSTVSSAATLKKQQCIYFGSYPQSKVTNTAIVSALSSSKVAWKNYNYISTDKSTDVMYYKDVYYNGNKYRGVKIKCYRPYSCEYESKRTCTKQDENGYYSTKTYWFLYEPIKWTVLNASTGLLICNTILDSQPYNTTKIKSSAGYCNKQGKFANNYATSALRRFLNGDFANAAFDEKELAQIVKGTYAASALNSQYSSADVQDKVTVPSYNEVLNKNYGFSADDMIFDSAKQCSGTDYAKCQGLYVYPDSEHKGNSHWMLRTAGTKSNEACYVLGDGSVFSDREVTSSYIGIRPMIRVKLKSNFKDVSLDSWYTPYVLWASNNKILNGTSSATFEPNATVTRAMFVTILCNLSGDDISKIKPKSFKDVKANAWYAKQVEWAKKNKIVSGMTKNTFEPKKPITREQLAVMLYSYAKYKNVKIKTNDRIKRFSDYKKVDIWAYEAMRWAVGCEIINGNDQNKLCPQDTARRSEAAVMMKKFDFNNR